jgi:hypothetical protein
MIALGARALAVTRPLSAAQAWQQWPQAVRLVFLSGKCVRGG